MTPMDLAIDTEPAKSQPSPEASERCLSIAESLDQVDELFGFEVGEEVCHKSGDYLGVISRRMLVDGGGLLRPFYDIERYETNADSLLTAHFDGRLLLPFIDEDDVPELLDHDEPGEQ